MMSEWVTYRQAHEISGLSRTTLWRLISESEIEAARVGRAVRINRDSLTAFMKRSVEVIAAPDTSNPISTKRAARSDR